MNKLLSHTSAASKVVTFFRKPEEGQAIFYRVVRIPKEAKLIDFVLEAWKLSGRRAPSDSLSYFEFRSHRPHGRRPAGYLSVYVIGEFVSAPSLPAQS